MNKKACWGCAYDYLLVHHHNDLIEVEIYGEEEFVCPACYEEIPEDANPFNYQEIEDENLY